MFGGMPTRKTSVSLTDEAIAAANVAASHAGMSVSSWLSQAAIEQAWREQALAAADELYDHAVRVAGPLTAEDKAWVAKTLSATVGQAEPPVSAAA
jgi:hypothetical protein